MKNNNNEYDYKRSEYDDKIQDIKRRKRQLHQINDPALKKKIRKDLKIEQRGAKRSDKGLLNIYIKEELYNYEQRKKDN